jgi:hypothetical protein
VAHHPDEFTRPELFTHIDCDPEQAGITGKNYWLRHPNPGKNCLGSFLFSRVGLHPKEHESFIWKQA